MSSKDNKLPSSIEINKLLGNYQSKKFDLAENSARLIIKKYPNDLLSWKILGAVLRQTGRLRESLTAFHQVLNIAPKDAEGFFGLANVFQGLNNFKDAKSHYQHAIAINPNHSGAFNNLGIAFKELELFSESEASHKSAIALQPSNASAHNNLGVVLKLLSKYEEAVASYLHAIQLQPKYAEAHANLANVYQVMGRLEDSEVCYRNAIALQPSNASAHNNLGVVLKLLSKYEEAVASYLHAIQLQPKYAEAHANLANVYQVMGRLEDSEVCYRNAIALQPSDSTLHSNLGVLLKFLGRGKEAVTSFFNAISLQPDNSEAHFNIGLEFHGLGNYKKASEHFLLSNIKKAQSYNLKCLYHEDKESFFELYDNLVLAQERNAIIGHYGCLSEIKYKTNRQNLFCKNPLKYISLKNLKDQYNFNEDFIDPLHAVLDEATLPNRWQSLLINGSQTFGNLFELPNDSIKKIKKIILVEIEKYRVNFQNSNEGFITHWPNDYDIYGWLVKMNSGGELHPHMHDTGWITGSIYINVPSNLNSESGNIVVSVNDREFPFSDHEVKKNSIDIATGSICLFPSSLLHHTIPFSSQEERIVLAFDVLPK